jgi:hypothetical protein
LFFPYTLCSFPLQSYCRLVLLNVSFYTSVSSTSILAPSRKRLFHCVSTENPVPSTKPGTYSGFSLYLWNRWMNEFDSHNCDMYVYFYF